MAVSRGYGGGAGDGGGGTFAYPYLSSKKNKAETGGSASTPSLSPPVTTGIKSPATNVSVPQGAANTLTQTGQGFLDPNSDFYTQMMERLQKTMGAQTGAAKRSAALDAAESGFGAGASPALAEMQSTIGAAGQEALGGAMGDVALQAPQMGLNFLQSGGNLGLGVSGLQESARMGNIGAGLQQQGMALQQQEAQAAQQRQIQDQVMRMFGMALGSF